MTFPNKTAPTGAQDAFNRVWDFFVVQKNSHSFIDTRCLYRTRKHGVSISGCGVGCMMPDDMAIQADQQRESGIGSVLSNMPVVVEWFSMVPPIFLTRLQRAHDVTAGMTTSAQTTTIESVLRILAGEYGLNIPVVA